MTNTKETLESILKTRGSNYGPFPTQAIIAQDLKKTVHYGLGQNPRFHSMDADRKDALIEGLDMICHKISRICNGDPTFDDNWIDISGYSTITAKAIKEE